MSYSEQSLTHKIYEYDLEYETLFPKDIKKVINLDEMELDRIQKQIDIQMLREELHDSKHANPFLISARQQMLISNGD
jgi:hypothetical protein